MLEIIHVCTCFDEKNADAALVMLNSLIKNKAARTIIHFHAIATEDSRENFSALETPDVKIFFYHVRNNFADWCGKDYISPATYLRFMIKDIIPNTILRVLYLDADIIVLSDLEKLYKTDLKGKPLAAMPDFGLVLGSPFWSGYHVNYKDKKYSFNEYCMEILLIDNRKIIKYFNAGVLLIDLRLWGQYSDKAISFLEANPGLPFLDQDALSRVFQGNFVPLDPSYNSFSDLAAPDGRSFFDKLFGFARRYHKVKSKWRDRPKIIHYAGSNKPWIKNARATGLERYWWDYAQSTSVYWKFEEFSSQKRNVKAEPRRV